MASLQTSGIDAYVMGELADGDSGGFDMLNVVVMVSGGGTNLQAIIDAVENGTVTNARLAGVIASKPGAYALERAKKCIIFLPKLSAAGAMPMQMILTLLLLEAFQRYQADLIVLAVISRFLAKKLRMLMPTKSSISIRL